MMTKAYKNITFVLPKKIDEKLAKHSLRLVRAMVLRHCANADTVHLTIASAKKHLTLLVPARLATANLRLRASGQQTLCQLRFCLRQ